MIVLSKDELQVAKKELDKGNVVIFPTETVYGLGANALNSEAVDKIFKAKNRASNNPLIVHLKSIDEITKYALINNEIERKLINSFMPGPFTLILEKKDCVPNNVTCNLDTVGIRIPIDEIAHNLLDILDYPIAAPSANVSTKPSGTNIDDIIPEFEGSVNYIIDGGESHIGLESTVCKVIDGIPTILRPGFITQEDIIDVIGFCNVSRFVMEEAKGIVESPGMMYKHYSPNTKCILVDRELVKDTSRKYSKPIIIGSSDLSNIECFKYYNYGDNLVEIAHNIFRLLRESDKLNADVILIEATNTTGLGLAIMNRLIRTCEYNYIKRENEDREI